MSKRVVGIVGTMDTKGPEFAFVKERIEALGLGTLVVNAGIAGEPKLEPDVGAEEVAVAANTTLAALRAEGDRGASVAAMAEGAAQVVPQLYADGKIHGVISLGGSAGTTIGTAAMRALPVGVPKVMVSTLAAGDVQPYVGTRDIAMMYSVVDVAGVNRVSRLVFSNAANAIAGMVQAEVPPAEADDRPLIAATMFGVTTPCVTRARERLEAAGYEVLVFHATGTGGRAMEDLVRGGFIKGVLDVTTTELADEVAGGELSAGPDRMEIAGKLGIPQIVCPGALDMVNFGPPDGIPAKLADRLFYQHNPTVTLMRTTPDENRQLGEIMGRKLSAANGPVTFFWPTKGVSAIDADGQPFADADADDAFITALRANLSSDVNLIEMDAHINDDAFADAIADAMAAAIASE
ncbi:MAG: Tm-1-like ATP-binding domain-containing protein [Candidatus Poribacteria bacterium]